jgi:hypothetical protein
VLRHSSRDAVLVALAAGHGALLALLVATLGRAAGGEAALRAGDATGPAGPAWEAMARALAWAPMVALPVWWTANTVAHNFIHLPFFRARWMNVLFSAFLSLLLGVPQTVWRDRHLAHHADRAWRWRWRAQPAAELVVAAALWGVMAAQGPAFFLGTWVAGWLGGMGLCALQGRYEHVRGTVSHYGGLYNWAFFNDGWHVEHHARPGLHWSELARRPRADRSPSRWPAVLRWLEDSPLDVLERIVLYSDALQRFVLCKHRDAFRRLLAGAGGIRRVMVVGGGIFPRTALALRELLPGAELTVMDRSAPNLESARRHLNGTARYVEASYAPALADGADLVVAPLAFDGDKRDFYERPPAPLVVVHDWIWRKRGRSVVVSVLLLKRLNLVSGGSEVRGDDKRERTADGSRTTVPVHSRRSLEP